MTQTGSGYLTLNGSNTYTGPTTVTGGGGLTLDFSQTSSPVANIINSSANNSSLALGGGTLTVLGSGGTSNSQQFNGMAVNPGNSAIVLTGGMNSPLLLTLGTISRSAVGGTVDFSTPDGVLGLSTSNLVSTTALNNSTGILGAFATVAGTDWATSGATQSANNVAWSSTTSRITLAGQVQGNQVSFSGNVPGGLTAGTPYYIVGLSGSTFGVSATLGGTLIALSNSGTNATVDTAGLVTAYSSYTNGDLGTLASSPSANLEPTVAQTNVTSAKSFNTINLTNGTGVTMSAGGVLTLVGGGLLANTSGSMTGGTLKGSASGELIVNTPANFEITSVIANNGVATALTKAGSAALLLTGSETYSGATMVGAGTLQIGNGGSGASIGSTSGVVVGGNAELAFDNANDVTFAPNISGGGALSLLGSGEMILSGTNTYLGGTDVETGTLEISSARNLPSGTSLTVAGGGTFLFGSAAPITLAAIEGQAVVSAARVESVPEPGTLALLSAAAVIAAAAVRRKRLYQPQQPARRQP